MKIDNLSNQELQKLYAKDKAKGKEHVWERRSHKDHLENLKQLHEQARGKHGNKKV
jgi:hypothetical protein|tara:strand:+ start:316 stop:483 length:168 start_codon:yes stop_codon:yes gene_type:complete